MKNYITKQIDEISGRLFLTKEMRFFVHQKYKLYQFFTSITLNLCSATLIVLSVLSRFNLVKSTHPDIDILNFWLFLCSVIILVFGLISSSFDFRKKSREFFHSGNKINKLYGDLKQIEDCLESDSIPHDFEEMETNVKKIRSNYDEILAEELNHSDFDYTLTVTRKRKNKKFAKQFSRITWQQILVAYTAYYSPFLVMSGLLIVEVTMPFYLICDFLNG